MGGWGVGLDGISVGNFVATEGLVLVGGIEVAVSTGVDVKMSVGYRVRVGLGVGGSSVVVG